jgi:hypothetical protein
MSESWWVHAYFTMVTEALCSILDNLFVILFPFYLFKAAFYAPFNGTQ